MIATIQPSHLAGEIPAIASKSQAHRLLIAAALADRKTRLRCSTLSADIEATAACLRALGSEISYDSGEFFVTPIREMPASALLDAGESGSTLRFLLPVVCALGVETDIRLHGRLPERPLSPLWEELIRHGADLTRPDPETIHVSGLFHGGDFTLPGNVSSQFVSGLLFALPLTGMRCTIRLTGEMQSASYVDMTLRALDAFGVEHRLVRDTYILPAEQRYHSPGEAVVEGDWSNGAFWVCADRILGGTLTVTGLDPRSPQGDRAVAEVSRRISAGDAVVDCRDIPDLVPVLAVLAAVSPGTTDFTHAERLRLKESDRLAATASLLHALGGQVYEQPDSLTVTGVSQLTGGKVDSFNDHRIAMCAAVASLACGGPIILRGAEAVNKSYPAFWSDFARLGGTVTLEDTP